MPETDLDLLRDAAARAGEIALSYFKDDPRVWDKGDGAGPVTEADLAVNEMLSDLLQSARPHYGWLSEETPDDHGRLSTPRQFIIDPIDGTRAFIEGARDWAHSIAIAEAGRIVAGVVAMPARNQTFHAAEGQGAFLNDAPIRVAPPKPLAEAEVLAARPNLRGENWKSGEPPAFKRNFRSSLAYRMCTVAQGRFDAMLTLRPTWEWDIAAGVLIVTEAGGAATDRTGAPLVFNSMTGQLNGVVAGGPAHGQIAGALV